MRGLMDSYYERLNCEHDWKHCDNPFGNLNYCYKCDSYSVNGVIEQN